MPLTGAGYETGDPFTQGRAPVLGYDALSGHICVLFVVTQGRGPVLGYIALTGQGAEN